MGDFTEADVTEKGPGTWSFNMLRGNVPVEAYHLPKHHWSNEQLEVVGWAYIVAVNGRSETAQYVKNELSFELLMRVQQHLDGGTTNSTGALRAEFM